MNRTKKQPVRYSRRFSNELIEEAQQVFSRKYGKAVSAEEARQMLENLTGFFQLLLEWDRKANGGFADEAADLRQRTANRPQTPSEELQREGRDER